MIIKRITVKNFGSIQFYDAFLTLKLNILDTLFTWEISTAIELVLCSKVMPECYSTSVRDDTLIRAEVLMNESGYFVELKSAKDDMLKLTALDNAGNDQSRWGKLSSQDLLYITDDNECLIYDFDTGDYSEFISYANRED